MILTLVKKLKILTDVSFECCFIQVSKLLPTILILNSVSILYLGCRNKGISFIAIDPNRTLSEQGPFDVVLHKVSAHIFCRPYHCHF